MLRNKLVRSDGSVIDSSVIISCEFTEEVNSNVNLTVGNAAASELTVEMRSISTVQQGEVLTYYIIEDDVETKIGVFNAEKPTKATKTSMRFSAYDNIVKTEKNFSDWLRANQALFPMTLLKLVQYACAHCGVTFASTDFPNSGLSVNAFYADDITCRQVLKWAGEIAGRFIRANTNGALEFAWYRDVTNISIQPSKYDSRYPIMVSDDGEGNISIESDEIELSDDGEGGVSITTKNLAVSYTETGVSLDSPPAIPYLGDSLSYENYATDNIKRVQINHAEDDVGVIYPANADGNCFTISQNMILGMLDANRLTQIASGLYTMLKDISYVPFSVNVARTISVRAGDIIHVMAANGDSFTTHVMKVSVSPSGTNIASTGDKSYDSNVAVASEKYSNLTGKMLRVEKSVEGLKVTASDLAGRTSTLEQTTAGIKTRVETVEGDVSTLEQTAAGITARVGNVEGSVSTLTQTAAGLTTKVAGIEGDVSTLEQTASKIASRVTGVEGDVSSLEQTASGLASRVAGVEGNVSTLQQTASGIATRVGSVEGSVSTLNQTASGLSTRVSGVEGSVSTLNQTASGLTTRVGTVEGNYSTLSQTVNGLASRVTTTEGNFSDLSQDVSGIGSRVGTTEGNVSSLQQTAQGLTSRVEGVEGNYSTLSQTVDGFSMTFQTVNENISNVNNDLQNKYNERVSYIRFEDGNIVLGKTDSEIMLIQRNDRISFVRNVAGFPEVAWFSNNILHVTEGQFTVQLGIGNFGFRPGANGNLSFKKVVT